MSRSRVWVITGVSTGLGYSLALYVASQGDKVVGTVRSVSSFPERLKAAGVLPLVLDLNQSDDEVRTAGQKALSMLGAVDVLVNNAGCTIMGPVEERSISDFRAVFQTNFFGLLAFTQPFITHFRVRRTGHIINVSSVGGSVAFPSWGAYCASKAALDSLSDILSSELKLFGVRVLVIKPGNFPSAIWAKATVSNLVDGEGPSEQVPTVYTDPETQGYDSSRHLQELAHQSGQFGDPEKYAQRVYDMVSGTGLAENAVARPTAEGNWNGPWELNRVPLGSDSRELLKKRWEIEGENLRAFEAISRSTDAEDPGHSQGLSSN